jgi:hypothetical protein
LAGSFIHIIPELIKFHKNKYMVFFWCCQETIKRWGL